MGVQVVCNDVQQWAKNYTGEPAHAMVCDPPYELGFMGRDWDRSGIAFRPETWNVLTQHLHPGAFGACFASSRGWHRLACALEDAGMILHPSIFMLGWLQASGWPKSTKIDTQVDKQAGVEQEVAEQYDRRSRYDGASRMPSDGEGGIQCGRRGTTVQRTIPTTPLAALWSGHRYGLQALKPSLEPIIIWQKPYVGAPVDCIIRTGAGALWIDGARITGPLPHHNYGRTSGPESMAGASALPFPTPPGGRWPPNVALLHTPDCSSGTPQQIRTQWGQATERSTSATGYASGLSKQDKPIGYANAEGIETVIPWACAPECPVAGLETTTGDRASNSGKPFQRHTDQHRGVYGACKGGPGDGFYGDTGPVSRFFPQFGWADDAAEQLALADPMHYCPKASSAERSAGLAGRNTHPTIKPLALCTWLATLLLPPTAYAPRRLLVPFCGTGSEIIGGIRAGFEEIVGIEQASASVATAERRIAYWTGWATSPSDQRRHTEGTGTTEKQLQLW